MQFFYCKKKPCHENQGWFWWLIETIIVRLTAINRRFLKSFQRFFSIFFTIEYAAELRLLCSSLDVNRLTQMNKCWVLAQHGILSIHKKNHISASQSKTKNNWMKNISVSIRCSSIQIWFQKIIVRR